MGYTETEENPSPKTIQQRHMVMEQIRKSKMRLTPTIVNIHKTPVICKEKKPNKKRVSFKKKFKLINAE
jgi:hypothetical protein